MSDPSELKREREVQGLLQSWHVAQGSSLNVALNVDSLARADLHGTGYTPRKSPDRTLTALAQLAVFRLDVKRCMVSLLDASHQTILAEATRNLNLGTLTAATNSDDAGDSDSHGDLWLGVSILSRPDAVCEHALADTCSVSDTNKREHTVPGLVVPDCRFDARFKDRPYVLSEPGVRFYAGVPIVSRTGHKIGVYGVSDEKPRDGLSLEEIQFMQGVSQAVADYLEMGRDRVDRFKGERIVRGLAAFVEGCTTLAGEYTPLDDEQSPNPSLRPPKITRVASKHPLSRKTSYSYDDNLQKSQEITPSHENAPDSIPTPPQIRSALGDSSRAQLDGIPGLFQQAAEILRESALSDGVIFFGSTARERKGRGAKKGRAQPDDQIDLVFSGGSGSESSGTEISDFERTSRARKCDILACAATDDKACRGIKQGSGLQVHTLETYFSRYPGGGVFSFTEEGVGISSDDSASEYGDQKPRRGRGRQARMDHQELLKSIPGAKTVIFIPMFDYSEDKLAAGCFLWTTVAGRMLNLDEDLSFLRAFCNSIMSQVGRINTQKNEAAKTTFIASMSHELRSPLHGILGAAEFLKEVATDHSELVDSITTCGKTLLDTLNHVLDYSKINRMGRMELKRSLKQNSLLNSKPNFLESLNMTAVIDLGFLLEESIDAVVSGHAFKMRSDSEFSDAQKQSANRQRSQLTGDDGPVSVLLDIDPSISWMVRTQPGALRRIIMNLFGNALKYTPSGIVQISLRGQKASDNSRIDAVMRVTDTGKGMSEEFQRSRLFVPFSQEDSFQPGTGLGLSIVKQIVDSLGGTLEVRSELNTGTEVDVRLWFKSVSNEESQENDDVMHSIAKRTKGLNVILLEGEREQESQAINHQVKKLNEQLSKTCSEWFGMEVANEEQLETSDADVYLYCEPPSYQVLEKHFRDQSKRKMVKEKKIPIIVVCLNTPEAVRISKTHSQDLANFSDIVEVTAQPCGPRKLARIFSQCLRKAHFLGQKERGEELSEDQDHNKEAAEQEGGEYLSKAANTKDGLPEERDVTKVEDAPTLDSDLRHGPQNEVNAQPNPQSSESSALPLRKQPSQTASPEQSPHNDSIHVLVVDDNKMNLQLLVMFMKKNNFSYEQAEDGQEALDKYKQTTRRFDAVLMDISMPVMDGMESTKRIRDFENENRLPPTTVMALTGLASEDAQRDALSAGFDIFLPKPVRFAELKKLLIKE